MRKILLNICLISILLSCSSDNDQSLHINEQNYLIFGHAYGECLGESCVETFKLTHESLLEDVLDDYNHQNMEFIELDNELYEQVKNIQDYFPNQLLNQNETIFGCPDCVDGGALFIQYSENGNIKSWTIDQDKSNVPEYLHIFMDKVNEKIALINE